MDRMIRFRAWDKRTRRILSWDEMDGAAVLEFIMRRGSESGFELMQYTGLRDKYGVDIYEGDILRHTSTGEVTRVGWHGTMAGFIYVRPKDGKAHTSDYWWGELFRAFDHREVIGNIYENPELLQVSQLRRDL